LIHLQSYAHEAGIPCTLDTWDEISRKSRPRRSPRRVRTCCTIFTRQAACRGNERIRKFLDETCLTVTARPWQRIWRREAFRFRRDKARGASYLAGRRFGHPQGNLARERGDAPYHRGEQELLQRPSSLEYSIPSRKPSSPPRRGREVREGGRRPCHPLHRPRAALRCRAA